VSTWNVTADLDEALDRTDPQWLELTAEHLLESYSIPGEQSVVRALADWLYHVAEVKRQEAPERPLTAREIREMFRAHDEVRDRGLR